MMADHLLSSLQLYCEACGQYEDQEIAIDSGICFQCGGMLTIRACYTEVSIPTDLYRCYDADWRLLYVGISYSAIQRFEQHLRKSEWSGRVSYIEIMRFPSRKEAVNAEKSAIASEFPIYNIDGNKLLVMAGSLEGIDQ